MPHSPLGQTRGDEDRYASGWSALYEMLRNGQSWSGQERNVCFLNTADGQFADISALAGLHQLDDGRGLAVVDWNRDGALDLVTSNRNGPQVRLLLNRGGLGSSLAVRLVGGRSNRDGIGARVELTGAGLPAHRRLVRSVRAGDGFLSQSSKWLHFGLGPSVGSEFSATVWWPGGKKELFPNLKAGGRFLLRQGTGAAEAAESSAGPSPPRGSDAAAGDLERSRSGRARVVLASRLPLLGLEYTPSATSEPEAPEETVAETAVDQPLLQAGQATLVNVWASWCSNCRSELQSFGRQRRLLEGGDLRVVALSADEPSDRAAASAFLEGLEWPFESGFAPPQLIDVLGIVHQFVLDQPGEMVVPMSYLIDEAGLLTHIYRGEVEVETLLRDLEASRESQDDRSRATPFPGRWYGKAPTSRGTVRLANLLRSRGHIRMAAAYLEGAELSEDLPSWVRTDRVATVLALAERQIADGRLEEAEATLDRLDQNGLGPTTEADVLTLRAAMQIRRSQVEEAVELLRRAVRLNGARASSHFELGLALVRLDRAEEAAVALEQGIAKSSENEEAHYLGLANLAVVEGEYRGNAARAEELTERALVLHEENAVAWRYLGTLRQRNGRYAAAVEAYRRVLELTPDDGRTIFYLGEAYFALGDATGVAQQLDRMRALGLPAHKRLERRLKELKGP